MMADAKDLLEFLEGGVRMFFDVPLEFLRVKFTPMTPTRFGGQRPGLPSGQIAVNGTPTEIKSPGRFGLGAARIDEFHHPFPQVQRISFHAHKPITLCPNVNMNCYNNDSGGVNEDLLLRIECHTDGTLPRLDFCGRMVFSMHSCEEPCLINCQKLRG